MAFFSSKSKWIGINEGDKKIIEKSPAMQLRKEFNYKKNGKVECLICGLGAFNLYINGKKVNEDVLSPAFTAYDIRSLYLRYDVTNFLQDGKNVIAIKLGNGFFNNTTDETWGFYLSTWRNTPRLRFELFENENSILVSDKSWKATYNGATIHNAIREGEYYDARLYDNWESLDYNDENWNNANIVRSPGGELYEQTMPSIKECETFSPINMWQSKNGYILDFGQNIAGYVGFTLSEKEGTELTITYSEKVKDGELDRESNSMYIYSGTYQQDQYIFSGNGKESWKAEFVYHGFRYVEIKGLNNEPSPNDFMAYFVHTDLKRLGTFNCSNELLNWVFKAGIYSFLSNYHGIPTDCPHREKHGWTGDAVNSSNYSTLFFDMTEAYKKWLVDVCDTQRPSGQICSIAPTNGFGYNWGTGPAFDSVLFMLPYNHYVETGKTDCLEVVYNACKKYLNYASMMEDVDGTVWYGIGDWSWPIEYRADIMTGKFLDTTFYYAITNVFSKIANALNKKEDYLTCSKKAEEIKKVILEKFINGDNVDNNTQGALALPLYFDLVPMEQAKSIAKKLVEKVISDEYKFKVGIFGIKALLNGLSKYGYTDIAYKMVNRYDYPSYGFWKEQGLTTLSERWHVALSQNHHMYGDVLNWMARNIAGLKNTSINYETCEISPYFYDENCSATISKELDNGKIEVDWQKEGNLFTAKINIPKGVNAKLVLIKEYALKQGLNEINIEL
ncbi:MAG: family 78 glycoside hydrolase catalytic domain [Clostridia bacterium]|nr:family 78 glycoside hydrolase catalytic domain [Clostridia bacterium]